MPVRKGGHEGNRSKAGLPEGVGVMTTTVPCGTPPLGFEPRSQAPQACSLSKLTYEGALRANVVYA